MKRRAHFDAVGHQRFEVGELLAKGLPVDNIIFRADCPENQWLEDSMEMIGEWRAVFRSIYIKWSLAINGLHVAVERYSDSSWQSTKQFSITSQRPDPTGKLQPALIAQWTGKETEKHHRAVIPYIAGWGIIDLGSALEEFIFDLHKIFLFQHPESLIQGDAYRDLRTLRNEAATSPDATTAWEAALSERINDWQRKAVYEKKRKLFFSYCERAKLKTPSTYTKATLSSLADCVHGVFTLRNSLIHPNATVPKDLAEFCSQPINIGYQFREGEQLAVTLRELQCTECFLDQLLTGINFSLFERAGGTAPC
jgi:hypothetical protein